MLARGIVAKKPFVARRTGHFGTRRHFSLPTGAFRSFFRSLLHGTCKHEASQPKTLSLPVERVISLPVVSFRYPSAPLLPTGAFRSFFCSLPVGRAWHLASKPKCPAHAVWACQSSVMTPLRVVMAWQGRESTPPYICIF